LPQNFQDQQDPHLAMASIDDFHWMPTTRTVLIRRTQRQIRWTKTECRIFRLLQHGIPTTHQELSQSLYQCEPDASIRIALDKQIDRMRRKLRGSGVSIYAILNYGYLLMQEEPVVSGPPVENFVEKDIRKSEPSSQHYLPVTSSRLRHI
jgi:DNA-binding response OmpR family regulator